MGLPEAPRAVSVGLRSCYLWHFRGAATRFHLARFQHPLKALKPSQQLCPGTSRGPTNCFCWASKLLSGTSEAPQPVSIVLRNCHLARFQHPLKALQRSKLAAALPWDVPRPHDELFLLGFEAAIWHFRGATTCFYWASKLPSGTLPAPLKSLKTLPAAPQLSIRLRNCHHTRFQHPLKALQPSQQLCHGTSP